MTATDELRRMLDERGVEWFAPDGPRHDRRTEFGVIGGWDYCADESQWGYGIDLMAVRCVETPAQAIEATLGRRTTTRHGKFRTKYGRSVPCCECCGYGIGDERWHYCPSCGAEVVDE